MKLTLGQELGHYRIEKKIGQGGMGSVYPATDVRLERQVAIKVLTSEVTADEERPQRFHQEAMLAAAFNHPNIATVYDVGEESDATYIVMEYVRGRSLRDLVRDEPLGVERAIDLATGIAAGLAKAHGEGILHRDLKPDNVTLTEEGVPKILDFGLGKLVAEHAADARTDPLRDADDERRRLTLRHPRGPDPGDARVYVARAGAGPAGRRALGRLFLRRPPLRDAHR